MIILDIEASGLAHNSYPIEIAWQHRHNPTLFDSFLIIPDPSWTHWDDYAETHIHHISREHLKSGISPKQAANRLNTSLSNQHIFTDAPYYDQMWLEALFQTTNIKQQFTVHNVTNLVPPDKEGSLINYLLHSPTKHRALDDVKKIIYIVNFLNP